MQLGPPDHMARALTTEPSPVRLLGEHDSSNVGAFVSANANLLRL